MIPLDLDGQGPLHQQLSEALKRAILAARIDPGARLLPSRTLAAELGVSRNTVVRAYEQLSAEGYAVTRGGSGVYVAGHLPEPQAGRCGTTSVEPSLSAFGERLADTVPPALLERRRRPGVRFDFLYGEPAYAELPVQSWARIVGRTARQLREVDLGYAPHEGVDELRHAVAGYLARSRGVACTAGQVVIVQGTQEAIDLTVRLLIDPGDVAVLEEPHYRGFERSLRAAGATVRALPVDAQGLETSQLAGTPRAKLACVTPSHQFPVGGVLPLDRRLDLLDWSGRSGALILEDDYDGEFRYGGSPVPSLKSLDETGRVIYVGTASKIFFPSLRIGWMVLPEHLVPLFAAAKAVGDASTSALVQLAFAAFIREGHLERHVQRIRRRFARKRAVLLESLAAELGDRASVIGTAAGIHVLARLHTVHASAMPELVERCRRVDVAVYAAAAYYSEPPDEAELVLGYAALSEADIREGVRRLARVIGAMDRRGRKVRAQPAS